MYGQGTEHFCLLKQYVAYPTPTAYAVTSDCRVPGYGGLVRFSLYRIPAVPYNLSINKLQARSVYNFATVSVTTNISYIYTAEP